MFELLVVILMFTRCWRYQVMVVGPQDSGKSSLAHMLACYALRLDRTPLFVDLDTGRGSLAVPGALCATCLDQSCLNIKVIYTILIVLFLKI